MIPPDAEAGPVSPDPPLIFDGHNDTLLDLYLPERGEGRTFFERGAGHLDLPRAREGGFGGGFFACWTPNPGDEWTEESVLTPTEDGYEVARAPPLDPVYARRTAGTSWSRSCSS